MTANTIYKLPTSIFHLTKRFCRFMSLDSSQELRVDTNETVNEADCMNVSGSLARNFARLGLLCPIGIY